MGLGGVSMRSRAIRNRFKMFRVKKCGHRHRDFSQDPM